MKKRIVLCADDYGQAPPVSQGILSLIEKGRLSATSCMVTTPYWDQHAPWLAPFAKQIDIGLHVNLTEGKALSSAYAHVHGKEFLPLSRLLRQAWLGKLTQAAIEAECIAQVHRFTEAVGKLPDYLDGHQHVHQFPIIRHAIIRVYEQYLRPHAAYIRLVNEPIQWQDFFFDRKKLIIMATGTRPLKNLLIKHQVPFNPSFAGIYEFAEAARYPQLFSSFLQKIEDKGLIMCHPGLKPHSDVYKDPIAQARYCELRYFLSPQFLQECESQEVEIQRFHN